ncbi:MAG: hydrogenase 3 maturation endopeptidase HyCI [Planctomycetota bacterium]|jgi:hydrogenase 3 maturation protease
MAAKQQVFEKLNKLRGTRTVIVGIGNTLRGDDGAGSLVCQKLQQAQISAELIDAGTVPENYIQPIISKSPQNLIIIDAIDFAAPPGKINILKPEELNSLAFSTHTLSPRLFVDMVCQSIDVNVFFIGIQPAQIKLGQSVSTQVNKAIQQLTTILIKIFLPVEAD